MVINVGVGGLVFKFFYDYFFFEVCGLGIGLIYNFVVILGIFNLMVVIWFGIIMGLGVVLMFIVVFWIVIILFIIGLFILDRLKVCCESF